MKQLAELNAQYANIERSHEFFEVARLLLACKGDLFEGAALAERQGSSERVRRIFGASEPRNIITRAAVGAQTQSNSSALSDYQAIAAGFLNSLQTIGIFDRLLGSARRLPLRTATVGVTTVSAIAATLSEGEIKPLSRG